MESHGHTGVPGLIFTVLFFVLSVTGNIGASAVASAAKIDDAAVVPIMHLVQTGAGIVAIAAGIVTIYKSLKGKQ